MSRALAASLIGVALLAGALAPIGEAQDGPDLRVVHERAVRALVRIHAPNGHGSGWLLAQRGRPLIITNRHVATTLILRGAFQVEFYAGAGATPVQGRAQLLAPPSGAIDLAILELDGELPGAARPLELEPGDVVRGERVVLAGHPEHLPFQTTEGVVTGALREGDPFAGACGLGRNCLVVDAASMHGSSGGPAINRAGRVIGMLYDGPNFDVRTRRGTLEANPSFAYLIHVRAIEDELRRVAEARRR